MLCTRWHTELKTQFKLLFSVAELLEGCHWRLEDAFNDKGNNIRSSTILGCDDVIPTESKTPVLGTTCSPFSADTKPNVDTKIVVLERKQCC
eukprot:m.75 g.75  ORF g.75 m.75 type:complete len:92 (-) comp118_c0_seq1:121-396(-)